MAGAVAAVALVAVIVLVTSRGDTGSPGQSRAESPTVSWSATPYAGGAKLAVAEREIDFGSVPYGRNVHATFHVKNVGDQPVELGKATVDVLEGC